MYRTEIFLPYRPAPPFCLTRLGVERYGDFATAEARHSCHWATRWRAGEETRSTNNGYTVHTSPANTGRALQRMLLKHAEARVNEAISWTLPAAQVQGNNCTVRLQGRSWFGVEIDTVSDSIRRTTAPLLSSERPETPLSFFLCDRSFATVLRFPC